MAITPPMPGSKSSRVTSRANPPDARVIFAALDRLYEPKTRDGG